MTLTLTPSQLQSQRSLLRSIVSHYQSGKRSESVPFTCNPSKECPGGGPDRRLGCFPFSGSNNIISNLEMGLPLISMCLSELHVHDVI